MQNPAPPGPDGIPYLCWLSAGMLDATFLHRALVEMCNGITAPLKMIVYKSRELCQKEAKREPNSMLKFITDYSNIGVDQTYTNMFSRSWQHLKTSAPVFGLCIFSQNVEIRRFVSKSCKECYKSVQDPIETLLKIILEKVEQKLQPRNGSRTTDKVK